MNNIPPGSGSCCLPGITGISYIKIGPQGDPVGMKGLDTIFQQMFVSGHRPEDVSEAELVGMARKFNWIPNNPSIEAEYAVGLRQAYADFFTGRE